MRQKDFYTWFNYYNKFQDCFHYFLMKLNKMMDIQKKVKQNL